MDELKANWMSEIEKIEPSTLADASTDINDYDDEGLVVNDDLLAFPHLATPSGRTSPSLPMSLLATAADSCESCLMWDQAFAPSHTFFDSVFEPAPWAVGSGSHYSGSLFLQDNPSYGLLNSELDPQPTMTRSTSSIHPLNYPQDYLTLRDPSLPRFPSEADVFSDAAAGIVPPESSPRIQEMSTKEPHGPGKAYEEATSKSGNPADERPARTEGSMNPTSKPES